MFFIGTAFLFIVVNFWYIVSLIPIPGKNQKFKQRILNVKKDMSDLASDYDTGGTNWIRISLLIVSVIILGLNFCFHYVPDSLLIPLLIFSNQIILNCSIAKVRTIVP
jgi:hypothetical protein